MIAASKPRLLLLTLLVFSLSASGVAAAASADAPGAEIVQFMAAFVLILVAAKLGGEISERLGQPAVLGELVLGVLVGNLSLVGIDQLQGVSANPGIHLAAEIGVVLLLFQVGLDSHLRELLSVGASSMLAAMAGIIAPMLLGWLVGRFMLPDESYLTHLFLGATLSATSIGITARVLGDLGRMRTREAQIIIGAAVIDDVMGLVLLAVLSGLVAAVSTGGGDFSPNVAAVIIAKAALFLAGAVLLGRLTARPLLKAASKMRVKGMLLATSICLCFVTAAASGAVGLAPIVGAFAAGLVLEPSHWEPFTKRGEPPVDELIGPVAELFIPVFFVLMGLQVDLSMLGDPNAILLAIALIAAAVVGKLVCGLVVVEKGLKRMVISVGMLPRGEVGLIFAGIGLRLQIDGHSIVSSATYSAVVIMVAATTLVTPMWLKALYSRAPARKQGY